MSMSRDPWVGTKQARCGRALARAGKHQQKSIN